MSALGQGRKGRSCYAIAAAVVIVSAAPVEAGKKRRGTNADRRSQPIVDVQPATDGTVVRLLVNPFGDVDGLLLHTGVLVTFPAHMGDQLTAAVKTGDLVQVKGTPESASQIKGYVITNTSTNQSVMTLPKPGGLKTPKSLRRVGLRELLVEGEVRHRRHGKKGETNGVILDDGTIVRFSGKGAMRVSASLKIGQRIAAAGYGTESELGRALEATALGLEGQPLRSLHAR